MKKLKYLLQEAQWIETKNAYFPYEEKVNGECWRLRINDFPKEQLFTLFINDHEVFSIDDLPPTWKI